MTPGQAQAIAAENAAIKAQFRHVDDGARAIAFAVDEIDDHFDRLQFLRMWREGDWSELKCAWPEYLERCK